MTTPETAASTSAQPNYRVLVFATALCCLMFELVLARMVDFHLGADNAYLALPIAFLGLALGSLHMHLIPSAMGRVSLRQQLTILVMLCVGGLVFSFVFFSWVMPVTATNSTLDHLDYLTKKTVIFVVVMVMPFYCFGRLLTTIYQLRRDDIGSIYAADLLGAALACGLTPIIFAFGGLPTIIVVLTALSCMPLVLSLHGKWRALGLGAALLLAIGIERVVTWADGSVDYTNFDGHGDVVELDHAWNEHSRVAVVEQTNKKGHKTHAIFHNNSRSYVHVWAYRPPYKNPNPKLLEGREAAFVLGRKPTNVLVMFAGTGAEMIAIDKFAKHEANITGVELNGLVEHFGRNSPELKRYRISKFLDRKNIELVIDEGRHFLVTRPAGTQYDLIYMGSNAATTAVTGYSTKYLDTLEAYDTYLDLLAPGGLLVFDHQPLPNRIANLRHVFERRGIPNFEDKVIIVNSSASDDDMFVSPDGFTEEELDRVIAFVNEHHTKERGKKIRYLPRAGFNDSPLYNDVLTGADNQRTFTDDRPFMRDLALENYDLFPSEDERKSLTWYVAWIKVTTVIVLSAIAFLFVGVASLRRESRAPAPVLLYLVLTGFCFMLCEVAIMAKLELFLTQPLLSMAAVLSLFLLTSGIGSATYPRLPKLHDTRVLASLAILTVLLAMLLLDWMVGNLLHLPVGLKLVLAALATAPLGIVLGLFYPHIVSCLIDQDRAQTVSISYGLSTLSSVVGSAYALAAMIGVGFNALLKQAAVGYLILLVFTLVYQRAGGRWLSRTNRA